MKYGLIVLVFIITLGSENQVIGARRKVPDELAQPAIDWDGIERITADVPAFHIMTLAAKAKDRENDRKIAAKRAEVKSCIRKESEIEKSMLEESLKLLRQYVQDSSDESRKSFDHYFSNYQERFYAIRRRIKVQEYAAQIESITTRSHGTLLGIIPSIDLYDIEHAAIRYEAVLDVLFPWLIIPKK
jgi:hypothetical protein